MTQQEIYCQAIGLPFREQKELIEKLNRNLKREISENGNKEVEEKELSVEERKAAYLRLRGVAKMENPPMTREEIRKDYYDFLSKKYK